MGYLIDFKKLDEIKIKKDCFYPVDLLLKLILDDPQETERNIYNKYCSLSTIAVRGSDLSKDERCNSFSVMVKGT